MINKMIRIKRRAPPPMYIQTSSFFSLVGTRSASIPAPQGKHTHASLRGSLVRFRTSRRGHLHRQSRGDSVGDPHPTATAELRGAAGAIRRRHGRSDVTSA